MSLEIILLSTKQNLCQTVTGTHLFLNLPGEWYLRTPSVRILMSHVLPVGNILIAYIHSVAVIVLSFRSLKEARKKMQHP